MLSRSLWKSEQLQRWAAVLGRPMASLPPFSSESAAHLSSIDAALREVLDFCESDSDLSLVMRRHSAGRSILESAYSLLMEEGAFAWEGGHLVCLSALCFAFTLDYVLRNLGRLRSPESTAVVYRLVIYFRHAETDPVEQAAVE